MEKVHEIYAPLMETAQGLKPDQIQIMAVDVSIAPQKPLRETKQRPVILTMHAGIEEPQQHLSCLQAKLRTTMKKLKMPHKFDRGIFPRPRR